MHRTRNFIAGQRSDPDAPEGLPVINPATLEALGEVLPSGAMDVDRAEL